MQVKPGETRFFVTMRVTKKNENFECISYNPMAFHAGKSSVDCIEVKPMVCENIRVIGAPQQQHRMLLSGMFSSENGLLWKCLPSAPDGYSNLLPLMVFPMPMLDSVTYLGDRDTIAVELVFLLAYLEHQFNYFQGEFKKYREQAEEVNKLFVAVQDAAVKVMDSKQHEAYLQGRAVSNLRYPADPITTESRRDSPIQLDLW